MQAYPGVIDIFNFWVSIIPTQELFEHVKCPHTKDTDTETTKSALLYRNFNPSKGINQTKIASISKAVLLKEEETEANIYL